MGKCTFLLIPILVGILSFLFQIFIAKKNPITLVFQIIIKMIEIKEMIFPVSFDSSAGYRFMTGMAGSNPQPLNLTELRILNENSRSFLWKHFPDLITNKIEIPRSSSTNNVMSALWITHTNQKIFTDRLCVLYFHGGGLVIGKPEDEERSANEFANSLNATVLSIDYRLLPENTLQDLIDDTYIAYSYVINHFGISPKKIIFAGGSGGAMTILLALLNIKKLNKLPLPYRVLAICPGPGAEFIRLETDPFAYKNWISWQQNKDMIIPPPFYAYLASLVFTEANIQTYISYFKEISPDLPPIFMSSGDYDTLHNGTVSIAQTLKEKGVPITFVIYPGRVHGWELFIDYAPESVAAMERVNAFLRE